MEEVKNEIDFSWDMKEEAAEMALKEQMWKARTGLNEETLCGAIESLIFMSDRPISIQKIKKAIDEDLPLRLIHEAIEKIQAAFQSSLHGIRLTEVAEGFQFRTKVQFSKYIHNIHKAPTITLSPLALEVLAIIAFKQPISKMEVDQMRGVDSGHLIRGLIDKNLVKVLGKSSDMGSPSTYGTSDVFLELFNVNTLDDLPSMHELQELVEKNSIGDIENIKEIVGGDKEKFRFDEMDEIDELRDEIKSIEAHTEFTKLLKENSKKKGKEPEEAKTSFELLEDFIEPPELKLEQAGSSDNKVAEEQVLFSDEKELEGMLDIAFSDLEARTSEIEKEAVSSGDIDQELASVESSKEEGLGDAEIDGFEISDLSDIQKKIENLQGKEEDFSS